MKKIPLYFLVCLFSINAAHAQTPFQLYTSPGPPGPSVRTTEDANGYVGIGMATAPSFPYTMAFTVSNNDFPSPPSCLVAAINTTPAPIANALPPAYSEYSFAATRMWAGNAAATLTGDLLVDRFGLVGIGGCASSACNGTISAHLYVTDQNGDGNPLLAAYTSQNSPGIIVDQNGLVGIGNYPSIGGNGLINAHLYVTDQNHDGFPLLAAYTNTGNPSLLATWNGYVGIGTVSPATPLDVVGNATFRNNIGVTQDAAIGGNTLMIGTLTGLGAASFGNNVAVSGTTTTTNLQMTNGATAGYVMQSDANGNASWVSAAYVTSGLWTLATNGTDIYNTNTGKIGIGTNAPQATLDVQGTVRIGDLTNSAFTIQNPSAAGGYSLYVQYGILTERVKVALTAGGNWSDYVFDKDYKLASLSEVETFIKKNKHLPGVPSADEVCDEGIDMAQMDATLLKKIEELTLYVLELKKENEDIKKQIAKK